MPLQNSYDPNMDPSGLTTPLNPVGGFTPTEQIYNSGLAGTSNAVDVSLPVGDQDMITNRASDIQQETATANAASIGSDQIANVGGAVKELDAPGEYYVPEVQTEIEGDAEEFVEEGIKGGSYARKAKREDRREDRDDRQNARGDKEARREAFVLDGMSEKDAKKAERRERRTDRRQSRKKRKASWQSYKDTKKAGQL